MADTEWYPIPAEEVRKIMMEHGERVGSDLVDLETWIDRSMQMIGPLPITTLHKRRDA